MIRRLLERFRFWLLPSCDYDVQVDRVTAMNVGRSHIARLVRIDRALCRHVTIPRPSKISYWSERRAIKLKARSTAPFHNAEFAILWGLRRVSIFFWDRQQVRAQLIDAGVKVADDAVLLPSNFFEREAQGSELRVYPHGAELQVWDEGGLRLSRWFHEQPPVERVIATLEALESDAQVSAPVRVPGDRSQRPIRLGWHNLPEYVLLFRRPILAVTAFVFVGVTAYALGGAIAVWQQQANIDARQQALKPNELAIVEARKSAVAYARWIEGYDKVRGSRRHLPILEDFLMALGPAISEISVDTWEYDAGKLIANLKIKGQINLRQLVDALETHPRFKGVNAQSNPQQGTVKLTMTALSTATRQQTTP